MNKIEILCNIIVTTSLGAATPGSAPCEVHKQEQGWVSFLPESGNVADPRRYRLIKDQPLVVFWGKKEILRQLFIYKFLYHLQVNFECDIW